MKMQTLMGPIREPSGSPLVVSRWQETVFATVTCWVHCFK